MESMLQVSKPVIKSQLASEREAAAWLRQHQGRELHDQDGQTWNLQTSFEQVPNPEDPKQALYRASFYAELSSSVPDFLAAGVLHPGNDDRLVRHLGQHEIHLKLNPHHIEADSWRRLRQRFHSDLEKFQEKLRSSPIKEYKKRQIHLWMSHLKTFGNDSLSSTDSV